MISSSMKYSLINVLSIYKFDNSFKQSLNIRNKSHQWNAFVSTKTVLSSLIIFKMKNLSRQWISINIHNDWYFFCNSKEWTSNLHDIEWLCRVYDLSTREKANDSYRLLICDDHVLKNKRDIVLKLLDKLKGKTMNLYRQWKSWWWCDLRLALWLDMFLACPWHIWHTWHTRHTWHDQGQFPISWLSYYEWMNWILYEQQYCSNDFVLTFLSFNSITWH